MNDKDPPNIPLTDAHRAKFVECVQKWQLAFNMGDWRINLSPRRAKASVLAEVAKCSLPDRLATIRLSAEWPAHHPPTDELLDRVALHELGHVFLEEVLSVAAVPNVSHEDRMAAEHRVINTLVRLLTGDS